MSTTTFAELNYGEKFTFTGKSEVNIKLFKASKAGYTVGTQEDIDEAKRVKNDYYLSCRDPVFGSPKFSEPEAIVTRVPMEVWNYSSIRHWNFFTFSDGKGELCLKMCHRGGGSSFRRGGMMSGNPTESCEPNVGVINIGSCEEP